MTSQFSYDTELVNHIVAAVTVPTTRHFATAIDDENHPLVFSIGHDGKFYLVINNEKRGNELQNLSSRLGFGESETVQALAASQAHDGRIVVGFAIKHQDSDAGDAYILGPISPADLRRDGDLRSSLLKATNQPDNVVFNKFFIVSSVMWRSTQLSTHDAFLIGSLRRGYADHHCRIRQLAAGQRYRTSGLETENVAYLDIRPCTSAERQSSLSGRHVSRQLTFWPRNRVSVQSWRQTEPRFRRN